MSKFLKEAALKHQRGAEEHKQEWSKQGVRYIKEMKDELLDLYNYSTLDDELYWIGLWARATWIYLDESLDNTTD